MFLCYVELLLTKTKPKPVVMGRGVANTMLDIYCLRSRPQPWIDKMNLTANVKITDNHKSRKRASRVDDES